MVPIRVGISSSGDVSLSVSASYATPIGTFDIGTGTSINSIRNQYSSRLLIIRVDDDVTVYRLSENEDFKVSFNDKNSLYRKVSLRYEGSKNGDIILELERVSLPSSNQSSAPSERSKSDSSKSECPGAPKKRLQVGDDAVVCTRSDTVYLRLSPSKSAGYSHRLVPGADLSVIGGPVCDERNSWWYWKVETESGYTGWMAEGGDAKDPYFLCPN
ncbi:MAG: hypothetical protein Kow002_01640 [Anaerolineales bacterium]